MKRLYDLGGVITFVLLCSLVFGGKAAIDAVTPDDPPKQEQQAEPSLDDIEKEIKQRTESIKQTQEVLNNIKAFREEYNIEEELKQTQPAPDTKESEDQDDIHQP